MNNFDIADPRTILRLDQELTLARRRGLVRDHAPTPREAVAWGIACGLLSHPEPLAMRQGADQGRDGARTGAGEKSRA